MARRKLKDKVELSIFWMGLFCLTFLIFGFILKSDLTKPNDSSIFYEVLKDALTITAAFLAPITAFILFSDWRVEHKIKNTLQLLDDLKNLSYDIKNGLGFYNAKIITEKEISFKEFKNREDRQTILWQLKKLKRMNGQFLIDNVKVKDFQNLQSTFEELANKALNDLHFCEYFSFKILVNKNLIKDDSNQKKYFEFNEKFESKFEALEELSTQIDLQAVIVQSSFL